MLSGMDDSTTPINETVSAEAGLDRRRRRARWAEVLLGLVFLASALLKAADINVFIVQLSHYGVPTLMLQAYLGLFLVAVETGLAVLLVLGRWRVPALALSSVLLVAFTGVILYGWLKLGLDDCGCMGIVRMPPWASVLKNVVLLGLCVVAWRGLVSWRRVAEAFRFGRFAANVGGALVAFLAAAGVAVYAHGHIDRVQPEIMGPRPFSAYVFEAEGRTWDLGKGDYFVAMLSPTCGHCLRSVRFLNKLDEVEDFPPIVGLCKGNDELVTRFRTRTKAQFPLHLVPTLEFWKLVGMGPPRFILVRDGKPVKVWDYTIPKLEDVKQARSAPEQPGA